MSSSKANANPTKEFFVSVLGKDISLIPAIIDLVDNSVDGARRIRTVSPDPADTRSFEGLEIEIDTGDDCFSISDNCGGIPVDIAERYAFRFGRDPDADDEDLDYPDFATGQFGVGMKRALFKLGAGFRIDSTAAHSRFAMDIDVADWLDDESDDWEFELQDVEEGIDVDAEDTGTRIEVTPLHRTISDDLADETVLKKLRLELRERHMMSLHKGLAIKVNGQPVRPAPPNMIDSKRLKPAFERFSMNGGDPIRVDILCGVADRTAKEAGWSVFLNDRMVLVRDQSSMSGWGNRDGARIPGFHNQYGRFRGFVFLSCSDTTRLPWDTTKTELDVDRPEYRKVVGRMISLMEPVVRFLDGVDAETTHVREGGAPGPLLKSLESDEDDLFEVLETLPKKKTVTREFVRPDRVELPELDHGPPTQSIQFERPKEEIDRMKRHFGVRAAYAAGEEAWDYVIDAEDL
jgi:Histidine kinase-, DNA gyrase B-, and HSP90-like ATPase